MEDGARESSQHSQEALATTGEVQQAPPIHPGSGSTGGARRSPGKFLIVLLSVVTVLCGGVAVVAVMLQQQELARRQAKERELTIALGENTELKNEVQSLQQTRMMLEEGLAQSRIELASTQETLTQAQLAREELSHAVEGRQQEITRLTKELQQIQSTRQQLEQELGSLRTERQTIQQQLKDLEQAKSALESKVLELSEQQPVQLDSVFVKGATSLKGQAPSGPPAQGTVSSTEGQVIVVNREYDFIVMNLGKNQGVSVGQEFRIMRDSQELGRVKVEKLYDELSAATILPDSQKDNIREGDWVKAF